jgi:hypothetical protein
MMIEQSPSHPDTPSIICEQLGIDTNTYNQSLELASRWSAGIDMSKRPTRTELLEKLDELSHAFPDLPQDHNSRVLPRVVYAAKHITYNTHPDGKNLISLIEGAARRITPKFDQMELVLSDLMDAYARNAPPYCYPDTICPQDERNMPHTPFVDDKQKANFFLTSCLWMRRMNSVTAMRYLSRMFDDTRELEIDPFDPQVAATLTEEEVARLLEPYGQLQMRGFTVPAWIHNAKHLVDHFDGDARNIISDTDSYEEIARRMVNRVSREQRTSGSTESGDGFEGFQKKMVSMFLYYMIDAGIKEYFDFPMPVDIHVARFAMGCDLVDFEGFAPGSNHMTPQLLDVLRDMLYDYSLSTGTSQIDICNAIWLLGASACSRSPETQATKIKVDGRRSELGWYAPDYSPGSSDLQRFIETCGACAVSDHCRRVARGKENQLLGTMTPRERNTPESINEALVPLSVVIGSIRRVTTQTPSSKAPSTLPSTDFLF